MSPHGPIIYAQERSGLNNKRFLMYKFRTMQQDAESSTGPTWVSETNETRYIKGGKWLRKTSIDELPQFFNILKNDMSIVGPRPERPFFIDEIKKTVPHFNLRHKFKGGLTGWAQLNGRAYLTDKPHYKIKYDLYYIKNWSLIFDFKIMIKTFFILIKGDKAY